MALELTEVVAVRLTVTEWNRVISAIEGEARSLIIKITEAARAHEAAKAQDKPPVEPVVEPPTNLAAERVRRPPRGTSTDGARPPSPD